MLELTQSFLYRFKNYFQRGITFFKINLYLFATYFNFDLWLILRFLNHVHSLWFITICCIVLFHLPHILFPVAKSNSKLFKHFRLNNIKKNIIYHIQKPITYFKFLHNLPLNYSPANKNSQIALFLLLCIKLLCVFTISNVIHTNENIYLHLSGTF